MTTINQIPDAKYPKEYYHHVNQPLHVNGHEIHNLPGGDLLL